MTKKEKEIPYFAFDRTGKLTKYKSKESKTLRDIIGKRLSRGSASNYVFLDKQFKIIKNQNQQIKDTGSIILAKKVFQIEIDTTKINEVNNIFKLGV